MDTNTTTTPATYRYTLTGRRNGHTVRVVVRATDRLAAIRAAAAKKPGFLEYAVAVEAGAPREALAIRPAAPVVEAPRFDPAALSDRDRDLAARLGDILAELAG
jgi:hypothetical protein